MDLLRSGTLAALLMVLPGAAGCQSLFSKARIESPEEAAISKSVKARLAAEKTVNLTSVEVETNSGTVYLAWADRQPSSDFTLHVRRSNDRGATWSAVDLLTVPNALNAALAGR